MFDIAWSELLLIAVVALIFIGPKELPAVLHNLGRAAAKLRQSADEFRRQFEDSMRESGYENLHQNIQDLRSLNPSNQLRKTIDSAINQSYPTPKNVAPVAQAPAQPATPVVTPEALERMEEQARINAFAAEATAGAAAPGQHAAANGAAVAEQESAVPVADRQPAGEPAKDHPAPVA